jgi:hypothetical protein
MTPETQQEIHDRLQSVLADYAAVLANIAQRRTVLDKLERRTLILQKRCRKALQRVHKLLTEEKDPADWWRDQ